MTVRLILSLALVACGSSDLRHASPPVTTFRGLLDSLAAAGHCPTSALPPITTPQASGPTEVPLTPTDQCGLVAAAVHDLGRLASSEPYWAPADTSQIVGAVVFASAATAIDSSGNYVSGPDSVGRVELDIRGRERLIWFHYRLAPTRMWMGAVHRGSPIPGPD